MNPTRSLFGILLPLSVLMSGGCGKPDARSREPVVVVAGANEVEGSDETEIALTKKLEDKRRAAAARPGGKTAKASKTSMASKSAPSSPDVVARIAAPGPGEQRCFQCEALGQVTCDAAGCREGFLVCPGRCLKRSQGTWVPDKEHGGMAAVLKIPRGGTWLINEGHAGEVWANQGGKMVSLGRCPICGGRQMVPCTTCKGSGKTPCGVCEANGVIPASWKPTDNPWFNRQPDVVRLQDGRVLLAKEVGGDELVVMLKTREGELITLARSEVIRGPKGP